MYIIVQCTQANLNIDHIIIKYKRRSCDRISNYQIYKVSIQRSALHYVITAMNVQYPVYVHVCNANMKSKPIFSFYSLSWLPFCPRRPPLWLRLVLRVWPSLWPPSPPP